jgi:protein-glutamine gamma-glutamyltransferase
MAMIIVAGMDSPIDLTMESALEREIYLDKNKSILRYTYDSLEELKFELTLRTKIVAASRALLASKADFASFKKSRCNWKYWTRTDQGGFQQRANVTSAAAIRDIYVSGGLYAFECATAMVIVLYKAMLDQIGEGQFNALFNNLLLWDWNYDSDLHLITLDGSQDSFPGDILYFENPDVSRDTPEWQGENVVKLAEDLYYGHGIGNKSAKKMIEALNKHRKPNSHQSAYLRTQVTFLDYKYLSRLGAAGPSSRPYRFQKPFLNECSVAHIGSSTYLQI